MCGADKRMTALAASLLTLVGGVDSPVFTWRAPALALANGIALGVLIAGLAWDRGGGSNPWLRLAGKWLDLAVAEQPRHARDQAGAARYPETRESL